MKRLACRYAVVQFMPYSDIGEFVNAGVVLACPQASYFDFRLQTRRPARVTAFFEELDRKVYGTALQVMQGELERIQNQLADKVTRGGSVERAVRDAFTHLVHPREAIVRFGPARAVLTESPAQELRRLYDRHVDRAFATPEYVEATMTRRLSGLLQQLTLPAPFRVDRIGDDVVYATFPLVQRQGLEPRKVIKPFNLAQAEPNGIFDHGDAWVQKVRRLRDRHLLPRDVLFAVAGPPQDDAKRHDAFLEICQALNAQDVMTVDEHQRDEIIAFVERAA